MPRKPLIKTYQSLVFDCDGVLLNSNPGKTAAFKEVALCYGEVAANALVNYHVNNGGVSRYRKFVYFLENIVPSQTGPGLDELLHAYARKSREALTRCEQAPGINRLRRMTQDARWLVVSGSDQEELRSLFAHRRLDRFFDGGVFGSPQAKDEIVVREVRKGNIRLPALLIGDSRFDHLAARKAGLDFVFVSAWTEFLEWREYCHTHALPAVEHIAQLLDC